MILIKDLTGFQVWRYFRNLICGVEHCHEIGKIIHKDINVNNLLISEDDTVKLSDFDIKHISKKEVHTELKYGILFYIYEILN